MANGVITPVPEGPMSAFEFHGLLSTCGALTYTQASMRMSAHDAMYIFILLYEYYINIYKINMLINKRDKYIGYKLGYKQALTKFEHNRG